MRIAVFFINPILLWLGPLSFRPNGYDPFNIQRHIDSNSNADARNEIV